MDFVSIKLDDALLDKIHARLESLKRGSDHDQSDSDDETLAVAIISLTRDAYHRLEDREETLSREWCEKWDEMGEQRRVSLVM